MGIAFACLYVIILDIDFLLVCIGKNCYLMVIRGTTDKTLPPDKGGLWGVLETKIIDTKTPSDLPLSGGGGK